MKMGEFLELAEEKGIEAFDYVIDRVTDSKYFEGITEFLYFDFEFLDYFKGYDYLDDNDYENKINNIKSRLNN